MIAQMDEQTAGTLAAAVRSGNDTIAAVLALLDASVEASYKELIGAKDDRDEHIVIGTLRALKEFYAAVAGAPLVADALAKQRKATQGISPQPPMV